MTDQNMIPADKVRELIEHFESKDIGIESYGILGRFRALLPTPQPTTGLLGRWATHPDYGDVMCVANEPVNDKVLVFHLHLGSGESLGALVPLSSLTFPHQATRPEDVPAGEAWLVDVEDSEESHKSIVAFKAGPDYWRTPDGVTTTICWLDGEVTLICPLTPERPVSDLQAKYAELDKNWCYLDTKYSALRKDYDELEDKYREAQERIKTLEQASTPRTVTTLEEYAALPVGSVVSDNQNYPFSKDETVGWSRPNSTNCYMSRDLARTTRTVLRYGWGEEQTKQPAWRIEHDAKNLRVGDYIIDYVDDFGTVENIAETGTRYTDGNALGKQRFAPFIVFPNRDAATPEAIEEAKNARDEEMDK